MITCLNMFPSKIWISSNLSSAAIIQGYPNRDYNKLNITFGVYTQVYIVITNIIKQMTVGVIAPRLEDELG